MVKDSGFRRTALSDLLAKTAGAAGNLCEVALVQQLLTDEGAAYAHRIRARTNKLRSRLKIDSADGDEADLRQRSLHRLDVARASDFCGEDFHEVGARLPGREDFGGRIRAGYHGDAVPLTELDDLRAERRTHDEHRPSQERRSGGL